MALSKKGKARSEPTDVIKARADSRNPLALLAEETAIQHMNEKRQNLSPIHQR